MLTLSHFKGHPMSGYGRELKQLSIDCASSAGKAYIHTTDKKLSKKNCCKISLTKTTLLMQWQMLAKQLLTCSKATSPYVDLLKEIAYNIIYQGGFTTIVARKVAYPKGHFLFSIISIGFISCYNFSIFSIWHSPKTLFISISSSYIFLILWYNKSSYNKHKNGQYQPFFCICCHLYVFEIF